MEWIRLIGFCLLSSVLIIIVRQMNPLMAGLMSSVFGMLFLNAVLPQIQGHVESMRNFISQTGLEGRYYADMLKAMGIVLLTQTAAQICQDMGENTIAERVEQCGRLALLGIAVPVFIELTELAVSALR